VSYRVLGAIPKISAISEIINPYEYSRQL
jgi:hypothetical protein